MTNFRLSNLDVNPFNNIHMNFSVMNKNSEKIITGNDSEQKANQECSTCASSDF